MNKIVIASLDHASASFNFFAATFLPVSPHHHSSESSNDDCAALDAGDGRTLIKDKQSAWTASNMARDDVASIVI